MAIFVVEDDAQAGLDHVDGHRTVALAISPYTIRGSVDSTFYSHTSMLKTIELMLGLPTLSVFDLIANDMRNSFQSTPNLTPYAAVTPKQSLEELNPPAESLKGPSRQAALASMKMNFDLPDAAPTDKLNRILWRQARGWQMPYPRTRQAVFAPYSVDLNDQEKEEMERGKVIPTVISAVNLTSRRRWADVPQPQHWAKTLGWTIAARGSTLRAGLHAASSGGARPRRISIHAFLLK